MGLPSPKSKDLRIIGNLVLSGANMLDSGSVIKKIGDERTISMLENPSRGQKNNDYDRINDSALVIT